MKECKVLYKTVVDPMTCIRYNGEATETLQIYNMMKKKLHTTDEDYRWYMSQISKGVKMDLWTVEDYRGRIHKIHIGDYVVDEGIHDINVFTEKEFYERFKIIS